MKQTKEAKAKKKQSQPTSTKKEANSKKKVYGEDALQIKCIKYVRKNYPEIIIRSTPQGANLGSAQGKKRKDMGCLKGFPDIEVLKPKGGYGALYIELKTKKGRLRKEQKEMLEKLNKSGYLAMMINDFSIFKKTINDYLNGSMIKNV